MTRIWSWLGASALVVGCRYVVSFDGLSGGLETGPSGPGAGNGGGGNGPGGSTGGGGADPGGGGGAGMADAGDAPIDVRPDTGPPVSPPILVYTAPTDASIRGITVFGNDIYWVEGGAGRGVFRMSKQGDASSVVQLRRTQNGFDVAVDAMSIYWSDGGDYGIWQMPITGGILTNATPWFSHNSKSPRYITVDDMAVVYVTTDTGSILSGISNTSMHPYSAQTGIAGIAFYAVADAGVHDLLWGYGAGIRYGSTRGGSPGMDLFTGASGEPVQGIATDGTDMFWISGDKAIKRGDVQMATARDEICLHPPQDLGPFADIAVDADWVYFTWPSKNQIYKCLK